MAKPPPTFSLYTESRGTFRFPGALTVLSLPAPEAGPLQETSHHVCSPCRASFWDHRPQAERLWRFEPVLKGSCWGCPNFPDGN